MDIKYEINKKRSQMAMGFAWILPRWLVELAGIRLWANATTGEFDDTEAGSVTMGQAIGHWRRGKGGDGTFALDEVKY